MDAVKPESNGAWGRNYFLSEALYWELFINTFKVQNTNFPCILCNRQRRSRNARRDEKEVVPHPAHFWHRMPLGTESLRRDSRSVDNHILWGINQYSVYTLSLWKKQNFQKMNPNFRINTITSGNGILQLQRHFSVCRQQASLWLICHFWTKITFLELFKSMF